jgi:hypothetical protein
MEGTMNHIFGAEAKQIANSLALISVGLEKSNVHTKETSPSYLIFATLTFNHQHRHIKLLIVLNAIIHDFSLRILN